MARKVNALHSDERLKECDHYLALRYTGLIPGTGAVVCGMCNTPLLDISPNELTEVQLAWQYREVRRNSFFRNPAFALIIGG